MSGHQARPGHPARPVITAAAAAIIVLAAGACTSPASTGTAAPAVAAASAGPGGAKPTLMGAVGSHRAGHQSGAGDLAPAAPGG